MDEQMLDRLRRGPWNSPDLNDVFAQADGIATIPAGVATDLGFTPSQAREILSHVPNGDFAETPPDTSSDISDVTNKLPDWSFVTVAGSSITARVVADSSAGSGYVVRFSGASGSTNDEAYIEAIVPIASSRARRIGHLVRAHFLAASTATSTFQVKVQFDYLKSDASTTTGTGVTDSNNFVTSALTTFTGPNGNLPAPSDAAFIRCRLGVKRTATNSTTATVDLTDVYTVVALDALLLADRADPTKEMAQVYKSGGALRVSAGVADSDAQLVIEQTARTFYHQNSTPYGARAVKTTNQSITDATATSINFNTEADSWDVNGLHDTSSDWEKIVLDVGGYYMVVANVTFASNATGNRRLYVELNGIDGAGTSLGQVNARADTGGAHGLSTTVMRYFSADDTLACTVYQNSGGALDVASASLAVWLVSAA